MSKVVSVWKCEVHGEVELVEWKGTEAYCPTCGRVMQKVGSYEEK